MFSCTACEYNTGNKKDYNKHLLTAKHLNRTTRTEKTPKLPNTYNCNCGKIFSARNSLWYHKKKCAEQTNNLATSTNDTPEILIDSHVVIKLLKQNDEFKTMMVEQYTQLQESNKQNIELQKQLVDAVKNNPNTITNVTNNTTNNNQKFNLNFFLNDTCKDAMSITDFLRNLNVHIDELEYIGNHGYVNGMTKMIMARLKDMDITKRPIHCTDIKRETMYIKDDAGWSKDTDELTKLRRILSRISMNNYRTVPVWRTAHPDCEVMETRTYEFCYKMMKEILGDVEEEQIKLDNKIIKTIAKELFVQK
jgi:hypothetical protein